MTDRCPCRTHPAWACADWPRCGAARYQASLEKLRREEEEVEIINPGPGRVYEREVLEASRAEMPRLVDVDEETGLKVGDKVKVTGIDEIGELVGIQAGSNYIVLWDKPPFDHRSHQQTKQRAHIIYVSEVELATRKDCRGMGRLAMTPEEENHRRAEIRANAERYVTDCMAILGQRMPAALDFVAIVHRVEEPVLRAWGLKP